MPTDETRPELPADGNAPAPMLPRRGSSRRAGRLGLAAAGVAVALVVALFAVLSLQRGGGAGVPPPVVPSSWQTYHDPAGLFSLRVPDGWAVHLDTSAASYGDRTGSATETDEFLSVSDPAQGSASAHFDVYASPIRTAFERHWYCQGFPSANTAFHGFPTTLTDQAMWLFDTANAHFQVSVWIPGVLEPPHSVPLILTPVPTATPLPATWVAVDRQMLATMLGSFAPTNAHALACS